MQKLRGLIFVSALLCAGSAHAFTLIEHQNTPTMNQLQPPPPPPSPQVGNAGGGLGAGKVMHSVGNSSNAIVIQGGHKIPKGW